MRTGRFAPRVPSMIAVVLASWMQAMDGDDAGHVSRVYGSENQTYSTLAVLFAVLSAFGFGYSCRRGFVVYNVNPRQVQCRVLNLPFWYPFNWIIIVGVTHVLELENFEMLKLNLKVRWIEEHRGCCLTRTEVDYHSLAALANEQLNTC